MIPDQAWQYGVLGVIAFLFAAAIIYLFRRYEAREKRIEEASVGVATERAKWQMDHAILRAEHDVRIAALRAEFEAKHRELVAGFTAALQKERDTSREHEDDVRKEFAELMENIAAEAARAAAATSQVLDKIYERFIGPRRPY